MCIRDSSIVDEAVSDIKSATANSKVTLHLWAFSNSLYFFDEPGSIRGIGGGGTDLIPSLDCALEWASQSKSSRGIIMVTDGYPTSCRNRKSTGNPQQDMANVLQEARASGIVISILAVGGGNYDEWFGKNNYAHVNETSDVRKALPECAKVLVEAHLKKN